MSEKSGWALFSASLYGTGMVDITMCEITLMEEFVLNFKQMEGKCLNIYVEEAGMLDIYLILFAHPFFNHNL
jgi:hypothetical protein